MIRFFTIFLRSNRGVAMVEFALSLPVLMLMFYGCIEITRYILITQKVEKLAHTVADATAQGKTVTIAGLNQLLEATSNIMEPFATGAQSRILISALYRPPGVSSVANVNWRYAGGGSLAATSALGEVGTVPVMPAGFTFNERENVIAAEVFYTFEPLVAPELVGDATVYRVAFYKPRMGLLTTAPQ